MFDTTLSRAHIALCRLTNTLLAGRRLLSGVPPGDAAAQARTLRLVLDPIRDYMRDLAAELAALEELASDLEREQAVKKRSQNSPSA